MKPLFSSRLGLAALCCLLGLQAGAARAAASFPALERPALRVRAPERAVLQAAALAGRRIVAVGERGIVALSDDGGLRWRQAGQVPASVTLTGVRFVDPANGWAVGHGGIILHSADGGETWTRQADGRALAKIALEAAERGAAGQAGDGAAARQLRAARLLVADGPDKPLLDLYFSDARHGFVIGAYNLFFETSDGGATWSSAMARLANPKALHLYAIRAQGPALYIVGEQGLMLRSQDAGRSFEPINSPYSGSWFGLALRPDGALLAAGLRGNAFQSGDQGKTWARLDGAPPASFVNAVARPDGSVLLSNQAGEVLLARAGAQLAKLELPPLPPLSGVLPLPDGALLAVGMAGALRLPPPKSLTTGERP